MSKILLSITLLFFYNTSVWSAPSQIIYLPDGTQMICFYHNGGKFVDCQKL